MKQLDLGCGGSQRQEEGFEYFGIDLVHSDDIKNVKIADLIIEPIPHEDNYFDLVTAHDFLEHVPMVLYYTQVGTLPSGEMAQRIVRRDSMIALFNEVYRVLKPKGVFYAKMPCYPNRSCFQDPQHLSFWTDETPNYFSGDYFGWKDHYGHKSNFTLLEKHIDSNSHLHFRMEAVK